MKTKAKTLFEDFNPYSHQKIVEVLRAKIPGKAGGIIRKHIQWMKNDTLKRLSMSA